MYSRRTGTRETERDRSPSHGPDRRASVGYVPRSADEPNGTALSREPPRGPKALDQARGHPTTSSRGRPFSSRPEYRDRERDRERERERERDYRGREPSSFGRRDDHRSDWSRRDRDVNNRDSRTFQSRRSRSPTRDRRDSRYSPPAATEASRSHRDPKESITHSSTRSQESSSSWSSRGGSYRGWGRGDYDRGRGRGSFPESDTYRARSRSREPWRERDGRDEREKYLERDSELDRRERFDRRDTERSHERDDREKDGFSLKRERPPSRNSLPAGPSSTVSTPAGNPTASSTLEKTSIKALADSSRRFSASTPTAGKRDLERGDYFSLKQETVSRSQPIQRAISPPPAPQVPAFGAPLDFSNAPKKASSVTENEGTRTQAIPRGPSKMVGTGTHPSSSVTPPTGPKAEREMVPSGTSRDGHLPPIESRSKPNLQSGNLRTVNVSPTTLRPGSESSDLSPNMSEKRGAQASAQNSSRPSQNPPTGPKAGPQVPGAQSRIPTEPASPASSHFSQNRPIYQETLNRGPPIDAPKGPKFSNKQWVSPAYLQNLSMNRSKLTSTKPEPDVVSSISQTPTAVVSESPPSSIRPTSAGYLSPSRERRSLGDHSTVAPENSAINQSGPLGELHDAIENKGIPNLEDEADEDEDPGLDEEYFAESERRHQRERQALLARRPLSPFQDSQITGRLLKLQLLQVLANGNLPSNLLESIASTTSRETPGPQHAISPSSSETTTKDTFPFGRPLRQLKKSPGNAIPTPPLEDLPFVESSSDSPSRDWWCDDQSVDETDETFVQKLWRMIKDKRVAAHTDQVHSREAFKQQYRAWRLQIAELDRQRQAENPVTPAPASPPLVAAPAIATTPIFERTRGAKNMTELDLQNILKASEHTAREEQERRDRGSNAKPDPEKEALIPSMLDESEQDSAVFEDTGHLISPGKVLDVFDFVPLEDDFTSEEQKTFTEAYVAWPKKWGKIAESLPYRDFQQCILHYYLTKQTYKYKELVRKNQSRRGRRAKGPTTRPKSNALMADLGVRPEVYEGDEFDATPAAVTDTGRPRRAAAPTFGDSAPDAETSLGTATRQRGGQTSTKEVTDPNAEKPVGRGKRTGPKNPRKPKGQQVLPAASTGPSPQKTDREPAIITKPPRGAPKVDSTIVKAVESQGSDVQRPLEMELERSRKLPIAPAAAEGDNPMNPGFQVYQQPHQPSSYWSVYEVKDFPRLLAHFGRDYEGISNFMRTKTAIMVSLETRIRFYAKAFHRSRITLCDKSRMVRPSLSRLQMGQTRRDREESQWDRLLFPRFHRREGTIYHPPPVDRGLWLQVQIQLNLKML